MKREKPSAPPAQARAPLRAIYPRPTSAGRVIGGFRRAGTAESEVVVVSLLSISIIRFSQRAQSQVLSNSHVFRHGIQEFVFSPVKFASAESVNG